MIPTPEQLDAVAERSEGNLREIPFAVLLHALSVHERSAVLEIRRGQLTKDIVMEYGVPVDCRSNLVHETLGRFMVAQGKLTEEEHDSCLRESVTQGVQFGEVLRERNLVDSSELFRILQQNLAKKLLDGFTYSDGEYRIVSDPPPVRSPLKVRVPQLIVTGLTRFAPQPEVNAAVWPLAGRQVQLHPSPPRRLRRIKLTQRQRAVIRILRKPHSIKDAAEVSEVPFEEVTRLVYALALLGAVADAEGLEPFTEDTPPWLWRSADSGVALTTPGGRPPTGERDAEELSPEEAGRIRNRVMEAFLAHRKQDAFDLLEVAVTSTVAEIRERFLLFAHRYAPWRFRRRELIQIAEEAEDLFIAGCRAFGELMDPEQRNTLLYRRKVKAEEAARPKPAADLKIQTDLLDPEKQYAKGQALLQEGRIRDALEHFEFAADCDPQNAGYRAEAAFCRFLASPEYNAEESLAELGEALRIDGACGIAAYYAGEIHRQQGHWDQSEAYLRRANQLMSPDRRPIEALRTLARERKKRR